MSILLFFFTRAGDDYNFFLPLVTAGLFLCYGCCILCLTGEKPSVIIYDLHSLRKRKILSSSDIHSDEYISLAFSPDSKYLATQSSSPDWTLLYWTWEKAKVMASVKTSNPQGNAAVNQVRALYSRLTGNKV